MTPSFNILLRLALQCFYSPEKLESLFQYPIISLVKLGTAQPQHVPCKQHRTPVMSEWASILSVTINLVNSEFLVQDLG